MGFAGFFRRTGIGKRLVTLPVLLFLVSPFLFALDLVSLSLNQTKLAKGDYLYISLIIDHPFPDDIVIDEPGFPLSLQLYWGPSIRPVTIKTDTGERRVTEARYKMKAVRTGWYTLNPFSVTVGGFVNRTMTTGARAFGIGNKKGSEVIIPVEVSWKPGREKVYVGEAVPLVLELNNQETIPRIRSFDVSNPNTGLFEKTSSFREISAEPFGDIMLYTVPVASYMFTPTQPVRVSIPPARVETEQGSGKSGTVTLKVLPLPEEAQQYGAVGNFVVTSRIEEGDVQGQDVVFYIRIEGEGNLGYFKFPEPTSEGGVLVEQTEEYSFEPSPGGYKGYREEYFRFSPLSGSDMVLFLPEWTWLDPDTGIVHRIPEKEERVEVRLPEQAEEAGRADDVILPPLKSLEEIVRAKHIDRYLNVRSYLWSLPGIVLFVLVLVLRKRNILFVTVLLLFISAGRNEIDPSAHPLLQKGIESYRQEDFSKAASWFYKALEEYEETAPLLFNYGLASFRDNAPGTALYALRRANYLDPGDTVIRDAIFSIEKYMELSDLSEPVFKTHPDTFFFLWLAAVNSVCLAGALYFLRRRAFYAILFILVIAVFTGITGVFIHSAFERTRQYGVVTEAVPVHKVPGELAADWFDLSEGTSLRILYRTGGFMFIQTGFGLTGWVREEDVRPVSPGPGVLSLP